VRIALEATAACSAARGGIARYTIALAEALARGDDEVTLYYRLSRWPRRALRPAVPGTRARWVQEPWWPPAARADVVHGTDARVPAWRAPRVATLHDVFSLLTDEFADDAFRAKKRRTYERLAKVCTRILAVSASTRRDFLSFIDFPEERVDVVHEGVDARFAPTDAQAQQRVRAAHRLEAPYVLFLGELSRRKNLPNLISAYARSGLAPDVLLALGGSRSYGFDDVERAITSEGVGARVRLLGYVPDDDLPALYGAAAAFAFPTRYEGFGLPILEAMACGTPVVAGTRGAAPEVAGGHAVLAEPDEPDSIAAALRAALERTGEARAAATAHARGFTWEACAAATRAVYERARGG
jgi:glycosyltransferase involved in cell wall biosynthesis